MKTNDSDAEFLVTVTLIVADIARSVAFYRDVLGATVLREGEPTLLRLKKHLDNDQSRRRRNGR